MKKIVSVIAAMFLAMGLVAVTAAPAQAYTYKQNKVWTFVKKHAPVGASIMGKFDSIDRAKTTCKFLKSGYDYDDVIEVTAAAAYDAGLDNDTADVFFEWAAAADFGGIKYLCPGQWSKVDL